MIFPVNHVDKIFYFIAFSIAQGQAGRIFRVMKKIQVFGQVELGRGQEQEIFIEFYACALEGGCKLPEVYLVRRKKVQRFRDDRVRLEINNMEAVSLPDINYFIKGMTVRVGRAGKLAHFLEGSDAEIIGIVGEAFKGMHRQVFCIVSVWHFFIYLL